MLSDYTSQVMGAMKTMYFSAVLTLVLSVLPRGAFSQDIIYKTDGTLMHVDIVSVDGKTIKYRLPGVIFQGKGGCEKL